MTTAIPPLQIVYWTLLFNEPWNDGNDLAVDCPRPSDMNFEDTGDDGWCTVMGRKTNVETAAAIVFHAGDYSDRDTPERSPLQPWILLTMESPMHPSFRSDPEKMKTFDYLASYHFKSRFLEPYFSPNIMNTINSRIMNDDDILQLKTAKAPILWIASNCQAWSGRHHYVKELTKYIDVDSYGSCVNTKEFPKDKDRLQLMKEYKFYLAIENSNCDDYVTEKLFDTFASSTVPIVDGPASYQGFIPSARSVIRMDAYPDPRELADYIRYLDGNDTAYMQYFNFRRDNVEFLPLEEQLEPSFVSNWSSWDLYNSRAGWCSICQGIAPWWRARHDPSFEVENDTSKYMRADQSCLPAGKWDYVKRGPPYIPNWKPSRLDEFTRPWVKKRIPIYSLGQDDGNGISIRSIWLAYSFLCILFFAFVIFLQQRRQYLNNNGRSQQTYMLS